jgi:hypothetical protein
MMSSGVAVVIASTVTGMLGLLGMRHLLGPWGYRLAALPIGLLAWGLMIVTTTWADSILLWRVVVPFLLLFAVVLFAVGRLIARGTGPQSFHGLWADAVFTGMVTLFASIAAGIGVSVATADSWSNYAVMGFWLRDTGELTPFVFSNRGVLLPAIHAADVFFGGEWAYVVYPVMAGVVVALLLYGLAKTAFHRLGPGSRGIALGAVAAGLVSTAPFLLHSVYMHSHMITAMYLLLGVVALERAISAQAASGAYGSAAASAWMLVAGLGMAGVVYARPDGLAYAFTLHVLVALLFWTRRLGPRPSAAYFATVIAAEVYLVGTLVAVNGLYESPGRLSGAQTLAIVTLTIVFGFVAAGVRAWPWLARRLEVTRTSVEVVVLGQLAIVFVVAAVWRTSFFEALGNIVGNLFADGGYNLLWFWAVGVIAVAIALAVLRGGFSWSEVLLLVVFQFFVVALVVHGVTHPGREGWSDSFTRVAFHIVPVLFWLFGLDFSRAADGLEAGKSDGSEQVGERTATSSA